METAGRRAAAGMAGGRERPGGLREACVREALAVIEAEGVEALSLREVARRLGVSHQAPYRHFPSRDHILAEVVARAYDGFARFLEERAGEAAGRGDLEPMGRAYLEFAEARPLQYRLMFATALPEPAAHPEMMARARRAFDMLRDALRRHRATSGDAPDEDGLLLDALFVWSALHGAASIPRADAVRTLGLPPALLARAGENALRRIGTGIHSARG